MKTLHKRALRTAIVVVVAMHAAHCPSVTSGPDTGCVRSGKPGGVNDGSAVEVVGRLFPELPKDAPVVVLRIDETPSGIVPTAQYIYKYEPALADPLNILPQLGVDECQCIRGDGQVCDADAGTPIATTPGTSIGCAPIDVLGLDPYTPSADAPSCVFDCECDNSCPNLVGGDAGARHDGRVGARCIETRTGRLCTVPLFLTYDEVQQKYVAPTGSISPVGGIEKLLLTVELQPLAVLDGGLAAATCPASGVNTARLTTVTRTAIDEPASGATVIRGQDLVVKWGRDPANFAGFVMALVRGTKSGETRTVMCRGLDVAGQVVVLGWQLAHLDPGSVQLEVQRLNAASISAAPAQGGSLLSVSTRAIPLTLR